MLGRCIRPSAMLGRCIRPSAMLGRCIRPSAMLGLGQWVELCNPTILGLQALVRMALAVLFLSLPRTFAYHSMQISTETPLDLVACSDNGTSSVCLPCMHCLPIFQPETLVRSLCILNLHPCHHCFSLSCNPLILNPRITRRWSTL